MAGNLNPIRAVQVLLLTCLFGFLNVLVVVVTLTMAIPVWLVVRAAAKILRPDLGPIIGDMSSVFTIHPQEKSAASLNHYLILDGTAEVEQARAIWWERVMKARRPSGELMFPHFRDAWTEFLGYSFWKPEKKFLLNRHIRQYDYTGQLALPTPCYEEDLQRVMGGIASRLYEKDQSPWEVLLLQNYVVKEIPGPKTVIVVRHHHALMDGYGLVSMLRHLFQCKYKLPKVIFPKVPLWRRALVPLKIPLDCARMYLDSGDRRSSLNVKDEIPKELVTSVTSAIPIEMVKEIKNKLKGSYNTVVFTAIAGALARMMKEENLDVPEYLRVHCPMPMENHPGGTVNHAFLVGMRWRIKAETAQDRLDSMQLEFEYLKRSTIPQLAKCLASKMHLWPTSFRRLLFNRKLAMGSAIVSIFPATEDTIYAEGIKIHDLVSCGGALGCLSLAVLITGLNGNQHIVVTGNKHVFPGRGFKNIGLYIEQELNALMTLKK